MKVKWLVAVVALAVLVAIYGWGELRRPETTSAIRGERLARELGCFGCHGPGGQGGVADPGAPGGEVPDWRPATARLFVSSEDEIREWILTGTTAREAARPAGARRSLVPMPAYAEHVSVRDLDDLVAYFCAVSAWGLDLTEEAYQGRKIAERLGCFGCHGPSGMGGVLNPGSFKGHIPPWDGEEFSELVRDESELREWILTGRCERLWDNRAARVFLEGQKTPMPAYHDHLSDADLDRLVKYILSLRAELQEADRGGQAAETIGTCVFPLWRSR